MRSTAGSASRKKRFRVSFSHPPDGTVAPGAGGHGALENPPLLRVHQEFPRIAQKCQYDRLYPFLFDSLALVVLVEKSAVGTGRDIKRWMKHDILFFIAVHSFHIFEMTSFVKSSI